MVQPEPPVRREKPGDRLLFFVERWRTQEEDSTWYEARDPSVPVGWHEVFYWPPKGEDPRGWHWYARDTTWTAFRIPGDDQSYDAHVTAWRIESAT